MTLNDSLTGNPLKGCCSDLLIWRRCSAAQCYAKTATGKSEAFGPVAERRARPRGRRKQPGLANARNLEASQIR
jgi:hypothetical protein